MKMIPEIVAKARILQDRGLSYRRIGDMLGVSGETIRRNLNSTAHQYEIEYRLTHKAIRAQYRQEHKAAIKQQRAKYYQEHKGKQAQQTAKYYQLHRENILRYRAQYKKEHASDVNAYNAAYRAFLKGAVVGATIEQLAGIKEIYRRAKEDPKVRCYLCGKLIPKGHRHVDHIIPLSRGGKHTLSNLAIACDTCNESKCDKMPEEIGRLL